MRIVPGEVLGGHRHPIQPPAFSPDGARVVSGDKGGWLIVHERRGDGFETVARIQVPAAGPYSQPQVGSVAWPHAGLVAAHEYGGVRVRQADDLAEAGVAPYVGSGLIVAGGGGTWLAALGDAWVHVLDFPGLEQRATHRLDRGDFEYFRTRTLAADPAGPLLAVSDDGGWDETAMAMRLRSGEPQVTLIDVERGEVVGAIEIDSYVRQFAWDRWRGRIVTAAYRDIGIWSATGEPVRRFQPYESAHATTLAVAERWIATAARHAYTHATLDLWDADTFARLQSIPVLGGYPPAWIVASPDGRTMLTPLIPRDGEFGIQLWSVED